MTITAKRLQYLLFIEGVYVPAANLSFNNTTGQPCTLTASIPPHPFCYGLRRGMYVHLFKKVNDEDPVLRFSGMLMNKVYGKSGEGRDLRIECASPEIRLTSIKMCEVDVNSLSMMNNIQIGYIKMMEGLSANVKPEKFSQFIDLYKDSKNTYNMASIINSDLSLKGDPLKSDWHTGVSGITGSTSKKYSDEELDMKSNAVNKLLTGQPDASWSDNKKNAFNQMKNSLSRYKQKENELERNKKFSTEYMEAEKEKDDANKAYLDAKKQYDEDFLPFRNIGVSRDKLDKAKKRKEKAEVDFKEVSNNIGESEKEQIKGEFNQALKNYIKEDPESPLKDMNFDEAMNFAEANAAYESYRSSFENIKNGDVQYITLSNFSLGNQVHVSEGMTSNAYLPIQQTTIVNKKVEGEGGDKNNNVTESLKQVVNPTLARRFTEIANRCKNDYMKAIVEFIKEVYKKNNEPLVKEEASHFNILTNSDSSKEYIKSLEVIDWNKKVSLSTETQQNTGHQFAPIAFTLATTINTLIKGSDAGVPMMEIIQQMLNTLLASYSTIHTQLDGGMVVHPMMCNYFPPCRNVIFPGMMSSVQYNANDWANPTRTYMIFQSYLLPGYEKNAMMRDVELPYRVATAPKEARQLRYINYEIIDQTNEQYNRNTKNMVDTDKDKKEETKDTKKEGASTEERVELMKSVNGFNIVNSHFTDEEEEIGRTINIVNYGMGVQFKTSDPDQIAMADMYHGLARYGCRSCVVTGGDELDDLVVGMPVVVLDHVYSIYGVVESLSFNVMGEGNVQSSVTISMPRMPLLNKYDNLTHAGMWFDSNKAKPSTIGKAYSSILGSNNQSFYDKCRESIGNENSSLEDSLVANYDDMDTMDDDTVVLATCIARLNNKYIMAANKREFVENFRDVKNTRYSEISGIISSGYRSEQVKYYTTALGIQPYDNNSHTYACVTPDSLNYSDQGYISLNIQNTGFGAAEDEKALYWGSQYRDDISKGIISEGNKRFNTGSVDVGGDFRAGNLQFPVKGTLTSKYGYRIHPVDNKRKFHSGIDIGAPIGTDIRCVASGKVTYVGEKSGYGKIVEITHENGFVTRYAHCDSFKVQQGATVEKDSVIAAVGITGKVTGPHLHFEVLHNDVNQDPAKYLKSK